MKLAWFAGVSMPGYLPDEPPDEFETFDEAKRAILWILKADECLAETEDEAETICAFAEDVNLQSGDTSTGFRMTCHGRPEP